MKVAICIPYHDSFTIPWKFAESVFKLMPVFYREFGAENVHLILRTGTLISNVRNMLLHEAKKYNPDVVLWIDSDMSFSGEDGLNLVKRITGPDMIVSGLYFTDTPHQPNIYMESKEKFMGVFRAILNYEKDSFFKVDSAGFGFLAMGRKAIFGMGEEPFNELSIQGFRISEDHSFLWRARERGVEIWADTSVKVGHLRIKEINENNWLDGGGVK